MDYQQLNPYLPILVILLFSVVFACIVSAISWLIGPKHYTRDKLDTYECGVPMVSSAREKNSVKFYLTAILFILFDIETVFLFLWARVYGKLGLFGLIEVLVFIAILVIGYLYVLRREALKWE